MEFLAKLMSILDLSKQQRGMVLPVVLLYPLVYTDFYLYEPSFRVYDTTSRLLIVAAIVIIFMFASRLLCSVLERVSRIKNILSYSASFTPAFLTLSGVILLRPQVDDSLYNQLPVFGAVYAVFFVPVLFIAILSHVFPKSYIDRSEDVDGQDNGCDIQQPPRADTDSE